MDSLLDAMSDFSEKLNLLGLEPDDLSLFMDFLLVFAGKTRAHTHTHMHITCKCTQIS